MESRDAVKAARPVWREGWGKPHGAIHERRPYPYSTHVPSRPKHTARDQRNRHPLALIAPGVMNVGFNPYNAVAGFEVLTLHRDYFRLRKPMERRIYELARKRANWRI
jgi:hypothetical protein